MRGRKGKFLVLLCILTIVFQVTGCKKALYSQENPVKITVWHYYASNLQAEFEKMVKQFNLSVGKEKGISLEAVHVSNIDELTEKIIAASKEEVGADVLPDLIFAYSSTVLDLDKINLIADMSPYFSKEEKGKYVSSFLEEGKIGKDNQLKSFPVAKSTEAVYVENVKYQEFKGAVNSDEKYESINDDMLSTFEGIMKIADVYYQWTDSQTSDIADDGKAFFGIDATPNYISVGARQLSGKAPVGIDSEGEPVFQLDKDTAKKLWKYYMKGIVTGRFAEIGWYRADDMKTGDVISYLGSTGGATYFPVEIAVEGEDAYKTELLISQYPIFEGGKKLTIQQGAGLSVVKTVERRQAAAAEFIKWFTQPEQNVNYALVSGYSPVMTEKYTGEKVNQSLVELEDSEDTVSKNIAKVLRLATEQMNTYELTVDKEYKGSYDIRNMFGLTLSEQAKEARKAYSSQKKTLEQCLSEEAFEEWYKSIEENFQKLIKES